MRWSLPILAGVAAAAAAASAPAMAATTRFSIETDYRLGYDTNPFLSAGSDLSTTYIETSVAPKLVRQSEKGQVALSGHFGRTGHFSHYDKADSYGGELEAAAALLPPVADRMPTGSTIWALAVAVALAEAWARVLAGSASPRAANRAIRTKSGGDMRS